MQTETHYVVTAVFAGLNTLLLTFLASRRIAADKRERTNGEQNLEEIRERISRASGKLRTRHDDD